MNQEIKKRWTDALRSGHYEQGKDSLRNAESNSFCCLGVLTDLYLKEQNYEWSSLLCDSPRLPSSVVEWAELKNANPGFRDESFTEGTNYPYHYLAALNDDENMPFKEIADLIEKYL